MTDDQDKDKDKDKELDSIYTSTVFENKIAWFWNQGHERIRNHQISIYRNNKKEFPFHQIVFSQITLLFKTL